MLTGSGISRCDLLPASRSWGYWEKKQLCRSGQDDRRHQLVDQGLCAAFGLVGTGPPSDYSSVKCLVEPDGEKLKAKQTKAVPKVLGLAHSP